MHHSVRGMAKATSLLNVANAHSLGIDRLIVQPAITTLKIPHKLLQDKFVVIEAVLPDRATVSGS